jgi:Ca2+-binding RTX toxin-like protein
MRSRARSIVAATGLVLGVLWIATPAGAATCAFDSATHVVTIGAVVGETVTIAREGEAITVNTTPCDTATVANTDTVAVNSAGAAPAEVVIDQTGGRFEPGATPEPDGTSEIEFTIGLGVGEPILRMVGTPDADEIVVGADGINLNAAEAAGDPDVTITSGTPALVVQGGAGVDTLSVGGGLGTGAPGPGATLEGQEGDDLLLPGIADSDFDGGAGTDTVDFLSASGVTVDLGNGTVDGAGSGTIQAVENVTGSPGGDELTGDDAANVLAGQDGDDVVDGGGGDDTLLGGAGSDTVSFASAKTAITVDLRDGSATGDGTDVVNAFEHVEGGPKGDDIQGKKGANTLDGGRGPDRISGGEGSDELIGNDGNDLLFGEKGKDHLRGNDGRDRLSGGKGRDRCQGGADPDSFVTCEQIS